MEESPCFVPSRTISSTRDGTQTHDGRNKSLTTQKLSNHSNPNENNPNIRPPPGFMTSGNQHSYNKEGGRGSNFITNSLSFNLENSNSKPDFYKTSSYNDYVPSKNVSSFNNQIRGDNSYGNNGFNNANSSYMLNNNSSATKPYASSSILPQSSSSYNSLNKTENKSINYPQNSISRSLTPSKFIAAPSNKATPYDKQEVLQFPNKINVSRTNTNQSSTSDDGILLPNYQFEENCEMFKNMNVKNRLSSTPSGLTPVVNFRQQENELQKYQQQEESLTSLGYQTSYNPSQYQHSPQRYNSTNQFYNTIHPSGPSSTSVTGGSKQYNNVYNMKTASVYPNNLYNNSSYVSNIGSAASTNQELSDGKLPISAYDNPRLGRESEDMVLHGGNNHGAPMRKPPGLEKQIAGTQHYSQRGSPLSHTRNVNHASRRQAIYLPPNSRQLYEEIAIVGSAGSSSGRSSVSRQQSPLEHNFLQSSGSKHTSRGNSSEVDILESPSRYSPAPVGQINLQQHYQTKSPSDHKCSKPPLPPESGSNQGKDSSSANGGNNSNGPRPPPRTRPKSWTSSLFNRALRNNHRSVTFQRVEEEAGQAHYPQQKDGGKIKLNTDNLIIADECAATGLEANTVDDNTNASTHSTVAEGPSKDSLLQAKQQMLFYSLPRSKHQTKNKNANNNNSNGNNVASNSTTSTFKSSTRSRTPSPFRAIMKNLVKGVVHEHPRIGSDGESEEGSRTSEDVVSPANRGAVAGVGQNIVNGANRQQTINSNSMGAGPYVGVKMRQKNNNTGNGTRDNMGARKLSSQEEINKRLSLPADLKLPDNFVEKQAVSPTLEGPLSRATRRQSLSEIGFGRMDTYTKLDKLGEGTYATVFKGKSRLTDNLVALKEIRLEHEEGAPCTAIREVSLLKDLKHNNIVTLHDIVHTDRALTLVFEYLERDLKQYMDDCGGILSMNNVKIFLFQLIRGLGYCHSRRILHRDLKPQNLLINEMGELKLADFGLARAKSVPTKTYSNEVVTLWYRPPDVLLGSTEYSTPIDMWGVGCIFYEMASGRPLFPGSTVEDELHLIFKVLGTPTEDKWHGISMSEELAAYNFPFYPPEPLVKRAPRLDQDGLDLVEKFLLYEAKKRISARSAMRHPYFGPSLGPAAIENLLDVQSIFTLPGVQLSKDPGYRSSAFNHASSGKSRRQSMLL